MRFFNSHFGLKISFFGSSVLVLGLEYHFLGSSLIVWGLRIPSLGSTCLRVEGLIIPMAWFNRPYVLVPFTSLSVK